MAQAHLDLDNIYDEMSLEDSAAAKAFLADFRRTAKRLAERPNLGPPSDFARGVLHFPIPPYATTTGSSMPVSKSSGSV